MWTPTHGKLELQWALHFLLSRETVCAKSGADCRMGDVHVEDWSILKCDDVYLGGGFRRFDHCAIIFKSKHLKINPFDHLILKTKGIR